MSTQNLTQKSSVRNEQLTEAFEQAFCSQNRDNRIHHAKGCLCPDCLFLPGVRNAEAYVHFCENRLAKSTPRWQQYWQQQLNYAWQSLNYWKRQYQADLTRMEAQDES